MCRVENSNLDKQRKESYQQRVFIYDGCAFYYPFIAYHICVFQIGREPWTSMLIQHMDCTLLDHQGQ